MSRSDTDGQTDGILWHNRALRSIAAALRLWLVADYKRSIRNRPIRITDQTVFNTSAVEVIQTLKNL